MTVPHVRVAVMLIDFIIDVFTKKYKEEKLCPPKEKGSKLTTVFANEYTKRVEAMNKEDIDKLVGETTTSGYGIARYGSLLHNNTWCLLASAGSSGILWIVNGNGGTVNANYYNTTMGVRPKVYLVSGIRTRGRNISGGVE